MDHYSLLGVSRNAEVATVEKAFKNLSLKHHPDKANAATRPKGAETEREREAREKRNHERFVEFVQARDTLTDPVKRREYDRTLQPNRSAPTSSSKRTSQRPPPRNPPTNDGPAKRGRPPPTRTPGTSGNATRERPPQRKPPTSNHTPRDRPPQSTPYRPTEADRAVNAKIDNHIRALKVELQVVLEIDVNARDIVETLRRGGPPPEPEEEYLDIMVNFRAFLARTNAADDGIEAAMSQLESIRDRRDLSADDKEALQKEIYTAASQAMYAHIDSIEPLVDELKAALTPSRHDEPRASLFVRLRQVFARFPEP